MSIDSILVGFRNQMVHFAKSMRNFLLWCLIVWGLLVVIPTLAQYHPSNIQTFVAFVLMAFSLLAIYGTAKSQSPDRKTWIGTHASIVALGTAAVFWVPRWSGYIVAIPLVAFVFTPNVLGNMARRRAEAGRFRPAALYAFLASVFHPSSQMRFQSSFFAAQAVESSNERIAAFQALRSHGSSEQSRFLNFRISMEQDDWQSVLDKSGDPGDKPFAQKPYEIRAFGELGRIDEMITAYAEMIAAYPSAQSALALNDLLSCRVMVMAFSGRLDTVHTLLGRFPRILGSREKAYWFFVAAQAAGADDEEARRDLMSHADAANDEGFRRRALRHLNAATTPSRSAVSAESLATIAAIEETLRKTNGTATN